MKVVKNKAGKIVYRSEPEFERGLGIKGAVALHGGSPEDYVEVEIDDKEWEAHASYKTVEQLIKERVQKILREQAIKELRREGKI